MSVLSVLTEKTSFGIFDVYDIMFCFGVWDKLLFGGPLGDQMVGL